MEEVRGSSPLGPTILDTKARVKSLVLFYIIGDIRVRNRVGSLMRLVTHRYYYKNDNTLVLAISCQYCYISTCKAKFCDVLQ